MRPNPRKHPNTQTTRFEASMGEVRWTRSRRMAIDAQNLGLFGFLGFFGVSSVPWYCENQSQPYGFWEQEYDSGVYFGIRD